MKFIKDIASMLALSIALIAPVSLSAQSIGNSTSADVHTSTNNNIGSDTKVNSNSTTTNDVANTAQATATSNGVVDSSTDNSVQVQIMANQDLASNTTGITIQGGAEAPGGTQTIQTGSAIIGNGAFANAGGVFNNAWNNGLASNAQAATNIAAQANGGFGK